jgi:hypothetical protein
MFNLTIIQNTNFAVIFVNVTTVNPLINNHYVNLKRDTPVIIRKTFQHLFGLH